MPSPRFALNHMVAPQLTVADFFQLGKALDIEEFEIRNDLTGNAILNGTAPESIRDLSRQNSISIISINALQRFNEWNSAREEEARALANYAHDCGAKALVLVPVNDASGKKEGERQRNLSVALRALTPILEDRGLTGLVEPLGFQTCSLRSKKEAAEAIRLVNGQARFKLVHDTFHHILAGEPELFPELTGLVHISGVEDQDVNLSDMRDAHRTMVTEHDRLDNAGQIKSLLAAGYRGPFSFEPFAASVHASESPKEMIRASIDLLRSTI